MPKCSEHKLEQLQPAEKLAHDTATRHMQIGDSVPPNTAAVLLAAIQRMAHELGHAHQGGLECDRK